MNRIKTLQFICIRCGNLLIDKNKHKNKINELKNVKQDKRMKKISDLLVVLKKCNPECGVNQPIITKKILIKYFMK